MTIDDVIVECLIRLANGVEINSLYDCFRACGALTALTVLVLGAVCFFSATFELLFDYCEKKRIRKKYLKEHRFDRFRIDTLPNGNFLVYEDLDEVGQYPLHALTNPYNAQDICDILNMDRIGKRYTPKAFKKLSDSLQAEDINNLKTTENGGEKE